MQGMILGVKTVFISWGLLLSFAFLYGGARLLRMLQSMPSSEFATNADGEQSKGMRNMVMERHGNMFKLENLI